MPNEIEAKFAVVDAIVAKQLRTVKTVDTFTLTTRGKTLRVRDVYLDTRDQRLLAAGYACRRRKSGDNLIFTVKQIKNARGAIHEREEFEIILDKDVPPAQWPDSAARDRVLSLIDDAPLQTLFELRQTRAKRELVKNESVIAEWSMDAVSVRAGDKRLRFAELEIELVSPGTIADLENIASRVQARWELVPEAQSKFERVLAWLNEAKSTRKKLRRHVSAITLNDTMAAAARKTMLRHWERMLASEAGVRAGSEIESVHDMRVATRRLRAALRVFADYLDTDTFKPFAKMLRRTARALGAVRDLDVFREKTQRYLDILPDERQSELDTLLAKWQIEHQRAHAELVAWLDSTAYAQLRTTFEEFLRTPDVTLTRTRDDAPIPYRIRDVLPFILLQGWAAVRVYNEFVSMPDVPLTRLHQLRIAAKGLRYTIEFFADVLNPEVQPLIEQIQRLQDHLGNLQDAIVACDILRNFLFWGEWQHVTRRSPRRRPALVVAPGVAIYLAARQDEIHVLAQTFPQVWWPINNSNFKRQLLALVAEW